MSSTGAGSGFDSEIGNRPAAKYGDLPSSAASTYGTTTGRPRQSTAGRLLAMLICVGISLNSGSAPCTMLLTTVAGFPTSAAANTVKGVMLWFQRNAWFGTFSAPS